MTYLTPSERADALAAAFDAVLNEEVKLLTSVLALARDAITDGNREVMRSGLDEIIGMIAPLIDDQ